MVAQYQQFNNLKNKTMNLPTVVTDFINAQNNFDSEASANCFSETGTRLPKSYRITIKKDVSCVFRQNSTVYYAAK
jgi:hypothetical protein